MGGDWYTFPSHFFLPTSTKLQYLEDNFHGLLPQLFPYSQGSSIPSVLPVNDQNREEKTRYTQLNLCDYLVMTTPSCFDTNNYSTNNCKIDSLTPLQKEILVDKKVPIKIEKCEKIIDPIHSTSAIAKAYSIPYLSTKTNQFKYYCLYSIQKEN